jgi:hypothetical protein
VRLSINRRLNRNSRRPPAADLRLAEDGIRRILELLFEAPSRGAFCYSRVPCSGGYVMRVPSTRANGVS